MAGEAERSALKASWDHFRAQLAERPHDAAVLLRVARLALVLGRPRQSAELLVDRAELLVVQGRLPDAARDCARALVCDARSQRASELAARLSQLGHRPEPGAFEDLGGLFADDLLADLKGPPTPLPAVEAPSRPAPGGRAGEPVFEASALLAVHDADEVDGLEQLLSRAPQHVNPPTLSSDLLDSVDSLDGSLDGQDDLAVPFDSADGEALDWAAVAARSRLPLLDHPTIRPRRAILAPHGTIDLDPDFADSEPPPPGSVPPTLASDLGVALRPGEGRGRAADARAAVGLALPAGGAPGGAATDASGRAESDTGGPLPGDFDRDGSVGPEDLAAEFADTNELPRLPLAEEPLAAPRSSGAIPVLLTHRSSGSLAASERLETAEAISGLLFATPGPQSAAPGHPTATAEVFAALPRHVYGDLLTQSTWRAFAPGEVIVRAGTPADGLRLLASGRATVELPAEAGAWSVGEVGQDDLLGVLEWVEGDPWTVEVVARTRVELRVVPSAAVAALRRRYPAVDRALADEAERQEARVRVIGCQLFAALSLAEQEALSRRLSVRTLIDHEVLFQVGDRTEGVSLVGRGQVRVEWADGRAATVLGAGSALGVQAALHGGYAQWTVRADPQARIYDLDPEVVAEVLRVPAVRRAFEALAAQRRHRG